MIVRQIGLVLGAEVTARVSQLVMVGLASRALGPEAFGLVVLGWSFVALALPIAQVAPETVGIRLIAEGRPIAGVARAILRFKLVCGLAGVVIAGSSWLVAERLGLTSAAPALAQIAWAQIGLVAAGVSTLWALRAVQAAGIAAGIRIVQSLAMIALAWVALALYPHPAAVAWAEIGAGLLAAGLGFVTLRQRMPPSPADAGLAGATLGLIAVNAGGASAATALWYVPLVASSWFLTPADFGALGAAWRLIIALFSVGLVVYQVFHAVMVRAYARSPAEGSAVTARLAVLAAMGSVVAVAILIPAQEAITDILFGASFAAAAPLFGMLVPVLVPAWIGSTYTYALLSAGAEGAYAWSAALACALVAPLVILPMGLGFGAASMTGMIAVVAAHLILQALWSERRGLTQWHDLVQVARTPGDLSWLKF